MRRQVRKSFREVVTLDGQANSECIMFERRSFGELSRERRDERL